MLYLYLNKKQIKFPNKYSNLLLTRVSECVKIYNRKLNIIFYISHSLIIYLQAIFFEFDSLTFYLSQSHQGRGVCVVTWQVTGLFCCPKERKGKFGLQNLWWTSVVHRRENRLERARHLALGSVWIDAPKIFSDLENRRAYGSAEGKIYQVGEWQCRRVTLFEHSVNSLFSNHRRA